MLLKLLLSVVVLKAIHAGSLGLVPRNREIFRDNFNGGYIDQSKWNLITAPSQVNEELEHYVADEVRVAGGNLILRSDKRDYGGRKYTSGRVDTRDKFSFTYGEVEWRAKLPTGQFAVVLINSYYLWSWTDTQVLSYSRVCQVQL